VANSADRPISNGSADAKEDRTSSRYWGNLWLARCKSVYFFTLGGNDEKEKTTSKTWNLLHRARFQEEIKKDDQEGLEHIEHQYQLHDRKVDKLSAAVAALTGIVQKSLAAGDESKEESKEEEAKATESKEEAGDESKDDELESTKSELEETKKELAAAKVALDEPDEKSLAAGSNSASVDANAGMLGFLQKNAHLD